MLFSQRFPHVDICTNELSPIFPPFSGLCCVLFFIFLSFFFTSIKWKKAQTQHSQKRKITWIWIKIYCKSQVFICNAANHDDNGENMSSYSQLVSWFLDINVQSAARGHLRTIPYQFLVRAIPYLFHIRAIPYQFHIRTIPYQFHIRAIPYQFHIRTIPYQFHVRTIPYQFLLKTDEACALFQWQDPQWVQYVKSTLLYIQKIKG